MLNSSSFKLTDSLIKLRNYILKRVNDYLNKLSPLYNSDNNNSISRQILIQFTWKLFTYTWKNLTHKLIFKTYQNIHFLSFLSNAYEWLLIIHYFLSMQWYYYSNRSSLCGLCRMKEPFSYSEHPNSCMDVIES